MDLREEARKVIDSADREMAEQFCRRMEAAAAIAAYKKERGLPVFDPDRERELTERCLSYVADPDLRSYYARFLSGMLELSRQYQNRLMEGQTVAYCGVEGAFADLAAEQIFPTARPVGFGDFRSAYRSVSDGDCDCAVLPLENSYAGVVGQVMDLMMEGNLFVNGLYTLPVTHHLLGIPGAEEAEIERVISHPQALAQCDGYLRKHGWKTETAPNTAIAAQRVAVSNDLKTAAIASAQTAKLYGLRVLDHDIQDSTANETKFAVFSRVGNPPSGRGDGAFLLMFTVRDVAGALAKAIDVIGSRGFNMKNLISRPARERNWAYYFYVEVEGDPASENGQQMLRDLSQQCAKWKVVGHYPNVVQLKGEELP